MLFRSDGFITGEAGFFNEKSGNGLFSYARTVAISENSLFDTVNRDTPLDLMFREPGSCLLSQIVINTMASEFIS